ncbi:uncharacterized protein LOC113293832 [Papaver somniferum]|uniref:uncharacterized protein LOC113293832 n=1 Tax=Papaver somniferum TaxID=3469 RepID=UPI000E6FD5F5|nr:uncharacterized protein LOC113293832 [Papaver somniferum]
MDAVRYVHSCIFNTPNRTKKVMKTVPCKWKSTVPVTVRHNYIYQTSNHRKIVRNSVTGPEFGIPSSTTGEFVTKLIQLNKEKMQKQRWDAAMQVEKIRASKTKGTKTRKNTSKAKKSVVQRTTNGLFLDTNYPCLSIYGEMDRDLDYAIKHLARNGVLIDFHDMKPIEDRLIVTDLGKKKYVATPEKERQMGDIIYLSLHYGPQWKQKHKIVVRAPHWRHMLLINTFTFSNVVKKMYPKNG